MKKVIALLAAALLLMTSALAAGPAAPMDADTYVTVLTGMLRSISSDYAGSWQPVRDESGEYVLSDGSGREGVRFLTLYLRDGRITAITVSYPWYAENRSASVQQIGLWSLLSAAPVAMQDGMSAGEAQLFAGEQLKPLMNGRIGTTHTVCGMEATLSLTEEAATVHYVFPGTPQSRVLAGDKVFPAVISGEEYMREFDDMWLERHDQRLVWSAPAAEEDLRRIVCTTLHSPTLHLQGDDLQRLTVFTPFDPDNPNTALINLTLRLSQAVTPLLRLQGMTAEEAEAACAQWMDASDARAGSVCAMNGEIFRTAFYGCDVQISLSESGDALFAVLTRPAPCNE